MPEPIEVYSLEEVMDSITNVEEETELSICPECEGANLNESGTVCWDCTASDYT
tara:strand:- start:39 stop:200 length:162 start_codon:yes stop_codon:yes gene_type:complete